MSASATHIDAKAEAPPAVDAARWPRSLARGASVWIIAGLSAGLWYAIFRVAEGLL